MKKQPIENYQNLIKIELSSKHEKIELVSDLGDQNKNELNNLIDKHKKNKTKIRIPCYNDQVSFAHSSTKHGKYYFYLEYNGSTNKYTIYDEHPTKQGMEYTKNQTVIVESTKAFLNELRNTKYHNTEDGIDHLELQHPVNKECFFNKLFPKIDINMENLNSFDEQKMEASIENNEDNTEETERHIPKKIQKPFINNILENNLYEVFKEIDESKGDGYACHHDQNQSKENNIPKISNGELDQIKNEKKKGGSPYILSDKYYKKFKKTLNDSNIKFKPHRVCIDMHSVAEKMFHDKNALSPEQAAKEAEKFIKDSDKYTLNENIKPLKNDDFKINQNNKKFNLINNPSSFFKAPIKDQLNHKALKLNNQERNDLKDIFEKENFFQKESSSSKEIEFLDKKYYENKGRDHQEVLDEILAIKLHEELNDGKTHSV